MSKTSVVTDTDALVSVDFLRESTSKDADGHYNTTHSTILSSVSGDLQPKRGEIRPTVAGPETFSDWAFFPIVRLTGPKEQDLIKHGSVYYRIAWLADMDPGGAEGLPQEYHLTRVTDPTE